MSPHKRRGKNKNNESSTSGEQTNVFNKFNDPLKFWQYQKSQEENQIKDLEGSLYAEDEAALIMQGFMNGLFHVHEMGYIHRDIKPENIQLAPKGYSHEKDVKIIDFGFSAK